MHKFNLISFNQNGHKIPPYVQWSKMYLESLNRDVLSLVEYINAFQTPWIRWKDDSIILPNQPLYSLIGPYGDYVKAPSIPLYVQILNEDETESLAESENKDEYVYYDKVNELLMYRLAFREYVVNEDIQNFVIFNDHELFDASVIGYYVSLCQTTAIDSVHMRYKYGTPSQYLIIPFSNGCYYSLNNLYRDENLVKKFRWNYVREAIDILGYSNFFNFHAWPCRFIYEEEMSGVLGALVFNWTGVYNPMIKDAADVMWTITDETVFSAFYWGEEEVILDCEWEVRQTKLQNTNQLRYNIMMKNESPFSEQSKKLVWEVF